ELRGQVADRGPVLRGHDDDPRIALGQADQHFFVGRHQRTTLTSDVRVARAPPRSSARSASTSPAVNATNQRSARRSMLDTPFPRTVLAMTTVGRDASYGSEAKAPASSPKS